MTSPFPWPGGKRLLVPTLLEMLPSHKLYVEVFSGSAKLLFAKPPSHWEILNDVNQELINFYRVAKHRPAELAEAFESECVHIDRFKDLRAADPSALDELTRAVRFIYLQWFSFGGKGEHFASASMKQLPRSSVPVKKSLCLVQDVLKATSQRLANVLIERRGFSDCIRRYDSANTFFFCDPPYLGCSDRVGAYDELPIEQHRELAIALQESRSKFLVTYNDHPAIRSLYEKSKGLFVRGISKAYTLAAKGSSAGRQLLITNYRTLGIVAWSLLVGGATSSLLR